MGHGSAFRSVVIGIDGSAHARRAVDFVARLRPSARARATVVCAVELMRAPSMSLAPSSMRGQVAAEVAKLNANRRREAQRLVDAASSRLMNAGWRARGEVRIGVPAESLLAAAGKAGADLLVVGARGTGGMARLLLGSVADAVSKRALISVLVVR